MNDLDAVAFGEHGLRPVGAPDDAAVVFDGEAFARQFQVLDEFAEVDLLRHLAGFAINVNPQESLPLQAE